MLEEDQKSKRTSTHWRVTRRMTTRENGTRRGGVLRLAGVPGILSKGGPQDTGVNWNNCQIPSPTLTLGWLYLSTVRQHYITILLSSNGNSPAVFRCTSLVGHVKNTCVAVTRYITMHWNTAASFGSPRRQYSLCWYVAKMVNVPDDRPNKGNDIRLIIPHEMLAVLYRNNHIQEISLIFKSDIMPNCMPQ